MHLLLSTLTSKLLPSDLTQPLLIIVRFGNVYLCASFWRANVTGSDSKGGTIVHEATHFLDIAGTEDIVYGQKASQELAKSEPDTAVQNADSHEYFVENNPALA